MIVSKPLIIAHHTWYRRADGSLGWQDRLKLLVTRRATNIAISRAIAEKLSGPSTIIPNAYRDDLFCEFAGANRTKELVFLGRLVSDKGVDVLLQALANLKVKGLKPQLTIIGTGPEEASLRQLNQTLELNEQVKFVGLKVGQELVKLLNQHQIMVIPSRWQEPFGIVALEGIACGCVVVGSDAGGLKDAIGPCGITFSNGAVEALTQVLYRLLTKPQHLDSYRAKAASHLARHNKTQIAKQYLHVMEQALWPTS